jgi:O-antigen/teichoic acid export membrane protein
MTEPDILDTPRAGPAAIRGSALRTGGYVVGVLLSVVSAPLLIRHLGVAEFGRYVTVVSIIAITFGVSDAGLTAVGVREYAVRDPSGQRRLIANLLGIRLALTIVGVVLAVVFAAVAGYGPELVAGTAIAGAGLLPQVAQNTLAVPLQTSLRLGWVTAAELLKQVLIVAGIVIGVVAGAGVVTFLALPLPAGLAAAVLVAVLVHRTVEIRPAFDWAEWRGLLRDTLPFAAATAISVAYLRIAVVLMSLIATKQQTGYFATSFRVIEVMMGVPALLVSTLFPVLARAARDDRARLSYAVQRIFDVGLILGTAGALALCLAADTVMLVLAGEDEADPAVPVLRIQAIGLVATFVAVTCQFALLSMRRHRAILLGNVVAITASVALVLALVPVWDARGAAVATTVAETGLAVTAYLALRHAIGRDAPSLAIFPKLALAVALALVPTLAGLPELAAAPLGLAIFAAVVLLTRAVPGEIRALVPGRA